MFETNVYKCQDGSIQKHPNVLAHRLPQHPSRQKRAASIPQNFQKNSARNVQHNTSGDLSPIAVSMLREGPGLS